MSYGMKSKKLKNPLWAIVTVLAASLLLGMLVLFTGCSCNGDDLPETGAADLETTAPEEIDDSGYKEDLRLYWNVDREKYAYLSPSGQSARPVDPEDGYYHVLFSVEGRQVNRRAKDPKIVNQIDNLEVMGLVFDEDGIIVGVRNIKTFTGGYSFKDFFVENVDGNVLTVNSSDSLMGMQITIDLNGQLSRCYDVSMNATYAGVPMTGFEAVKEYDKCSAVVDKDGKLLGFFMIERAIREKMYWNLERKYDSNLKATTRTPDADGIYHFMLACEGEQVEILVDSRSIASQMDAVAARSFGLRFDKYGYVDAMIGATSVTHGKSVASWYDVLEFDGTTFTAEKIISATDTGSVTTLSLARDCEIYNVSTNFVEFAGEVAELQVGDRVQGYTNPRGEVAVLYIVRRPVVADLFWNAERKYNSTTKKSTREKSEDGYYHIKVCGNGIMKEVVTRDPAIVQKIDEVAARSFGLRLSGNVITEFIPVGDMYTSKASWYDVMNWVTEDRKTFHVKKIATASDTGKEYDVKMDPNCKVYNMTSNAFIDHMGEPTSLLIGDRIQAWCDFKGDAAIIFVVGRDLKNPVTPHKNTHVCEDCGENVEWTPWVKATSLPLESGHYYLTGNVRCEQQSIKEDQHVVLCMNGYEVKGSGKRIYATFNPGSTLVICDCTGTAKMYSIYEGEMGTTQGALFWTRYGDVKIFGGTYDASSLTTESRGGAIAGESGKNIEIHNATIIGANVKTVGGAISILASSNLLLDNTTIIAGKSGEGLGDAICMAAGSTLTLTGTVKILGGDTNLYLGNGVKVTLKDFDTTSSEIHLSMSTKTGVFSTNYVEGAEKCFISDDPAYGVGMKNGVLVLGSAAVTALHMSETELTIPYPAEYDLSCTPDPSDAIPTIVWESSDPTVATVDQNGRLNTLKEGTATITARVSDTIFATCALTVSGDAIRVSEVAFDKEEVSIYNGSFTAPEVSIYPANATTKRVTYASSDTGVARVDSNGKITAVSTGKVTITVTSVDTGVSDSITVNVKAHTHCICGGTHTIEGHTDEDIVWVPWESTSSLPMKAENNNIYYYLTNDVYVSGQQDVAANTSIYICTNGYNVYTTLTEGRLQRLYQENVSLTITDCSEHPGTYKSFANTEKTQQGNVFWIASGSFTAYNITADGSEVVTKGGGATFEMGSKTTAKLYNVTIIGGTTTGKGGAIYTGANSVLEMYGCTVKDGQAPNGGNIYADGRMTIKDTTIEGGHTTDTGNGGNFYVGGASVIDFYDSTIANGVARTGGNMILATGGVFNMRSGAIYGGTSTQKSGGGHGGNVCVSAGNFYMYGGEIYNGKTVGNSGGNIACATKTSNFIMYGGHIYGGVSTATPASGNLAAFYEYQGGVSLEGGKIDGLVYIDKGTMTLKNDIVIKGEGKGLTINSTGKLILAGLTEDADIVIGMNTPGYFTDVTNPAYAAAFTPYDPSYLIVAESDGLRLSPYVAPTGVTVENVVVALGLPRTLVYQVFPSEATNKKVSFSVGDPTIASVSESGEVTGLAVGVTTVTVTTEDGGKFAVGEITVVEEEIKVTGVQLDQTELTLGFGDQATLNATISPENASYTDVTWTSSDPAVATVENGVVTAVSIGTATIRATSHETDVYAECAVSVVAHEHCICGGTHEIDGHSHAALTWVPWTKNNTLPISASDNNIYYYLTQDVYIPEQLSIASNTNIYLCLNGHNVYMNNATQRMIRLFDENATLTVTDCSETPGMFKSDVDASNISANQQGNIFWVRATNHVTAYNVTLDTANVKTKGNGVALRLEVNSSADLYNVNVIGGTTTNFGGAIGTATNTELNIYGGTVTGGTTSATSGGGGALFIQGTAHLYDVEIIGGNAFNGGGLYIYENAVVTMEGGSIHGGTALSGSGGCVYVWGSFTMDGTEVYGGQAKIGGNIGVSGANSVFTMNSGKIYGGKSFAKSGGGHGGNVAVSNGIMYLTGGEIYNGTSTGNTGGNIAVVNATGRLDMSGGHVYGGTSASSPAGANVAVFFEVTGTGLTISGGQIDGYTTITASSASISGAPVINGGTTNFTFGKNIQADFTGLSEEANIGISMIEPGIFTTGTDAILMTALHPDDGTLYYLIQEAGGTRLAKAVTGISVNALTITMGEQKSLVTTITPADAYDKTLVYSISDPLIASVDANGLVTALSVGTTTVVVKTPDEKFTASAELRVSAVPVPATSISLDHGDLTMKSGDTLQLAATVLPENTTETEYSFTSSDETVATVDENGLVTTLKNGTVTIRVAVDANPEIYKEIVLTTVTHVDHCVCGGEELNDGHETHEAVVWQAWESATSLPQASGAYYLTSNVTLGNQWATPANTDIKICLNGYTIQRSAAAARVISMHYDHSTLTITDCSQKKTGTIYVKEGTNTAQGVGIWIRNNGGGNVLNFYGGTIDCEKYTNISPTTSSAGTFSTAIEVDASSNETADLQVFNMYGGKIIGGKAKAAGTIGGSGLRGRINIYGGEIIGGEAVYNEFTTTVNGLGGTIMVYLCELNIYGGEIYGGKAINGGTIAGTGGGTVINIHGGTIYDGTVEACSELSGEVDNGYGGTIHLDNTAFNMDGGTIYGGTAVKGGAIYSKTGTVHISGGEIIGGYATLEGGAIRMHTGKLIMDGGLIQGGESGGGGGNIFLNINTTFDFSGGEILGGIAYTAGGNIATNAYQTSVAPTITMTGGRIAGGRAKNGGNITLNATAAGSRAVLNMSGGIIENGESHYVVINAETGQRDGGLAGNIYVTGTLNLSGGEIKNGNAVGNAGGNLAIALATGKINITGGTISGGTSTAAGSGSVHIGVGAGEGAFVMSGGEIKDAAIGLSVVGGTAQISGNAKISDNTVNIRLNSGKKLIVSELTEGASFGITMAESGVFAENVEGDYAAYFTSDDASYEIVADTEAKTLALQAK